MKLHVSFIIDETGSMRPFKQQTIDGFNEYVKSLQSSDEADDILFTLTKFNSENVEVVCDDIPINDVQELTDKSYNPNNLTPLYDAIGQTIKSLSRQMKGKKHQRVLVAIQTDGAENASREYDRDKVFKMIAKKKKKGWTFAFLGADQDAYAAAKVIGVPKGNVMAYASAQTMDAYAGLSRATVGYTKSGGVQSNSLFNPQDKKEKTK